MPWVVAFHAVFAFDHVPGFGWWTTVRREKCVLELAFFIALWNPEITMCRGLGQPVGWRQTFRTETSASKWSVIRIETNLDHPAPAELTQIRKATQVTHGTWERVNICGLKPVNAEWFVIQQKLTDTGLQLRFLHNECGKGEWDCRDPCNPSSSDLLGMKSLGDTCFGEKVF